MLDAGRVDVGRVDVGRVDVGRVDVGRVDVGRVDVGRVDVGRVDVGRVDALFWIVCSADNGTLRTAILACDYPFRDKDVFEQGIKAY